MAVKLGIDFGSRTIKICSESRGIILREPNIAAVDTKGNVVAVGTQALLLQGRAPGTVTLRRPIENNNITDFALCAEILDNCLEAAAPSSKKNIVAATKYSFGSCNRKLLLDALNDCHTGKISLYDSALAAAIGSGIDCTDSDRHSGTIISDMGAGSTESAYIRGGELIRAETEFAGTDSIDLDIVAYIRRTYSIAISQKEARRSRLCPTIDNASNILYEFLGADGTTGMPKRISLPNEAIDSIVENYLYKTAQNISTLYKNLPRFREESSRVDRIILTGGGALIKNAKDFISNVLECEILMPEAPDDCIINGLYTLITKK